MIEARVQYQLQYSVYAEEILETITFLRQRWERDLYRQKVSILHLNC